MPREIRIRKENFYFPREQINWIVDRKKVAKKIIPIVLITRAAGFN